MSRMNSDARNFLDALDQARIDGDPFRHWRLAGILTEQGTVQGEAPGNPPLSTCRVTCSGTPVQTRCCEAGIRPRLWGLGFCMRPSLNCSLSEYSRLRIA